MGKECRPRAAMSPTLAPAILGLVLLAVGTAGCTMCPDPFDYSGPVPNGAVTQNDFGARSNGILPLRATPCPWPSIVEAGPTEAAPTEAEPAVEVAGPDAEPPLDEAGEKAESDQESVLKFAESPQAGREGDEPQVR